MTTKEQRRLKKLASRLCREFRKLHVRLCGHHARPDMVLLARGGLIPLWWRRGRGILRSDFDMVGLFANPSSPSEEPTRLTVEDVVRAQQWVERAKG